MSYGDLPPGAAHKLNKGLEGGACNRERCQAEPALYYNHGSYSWYCADCARDIGQDPVNFRDWEMRWRPRCGHAQFETREETDARRKGEAPLPPDPDAMIHAVTDQCLFRSPGRTKPQSESLKRMLGRTKRHG